jgi:hypothetical protein
MKNYKKFIDELNSVNTLNKDITIPLKISYKDIQIARNNFINFIKKNGNEIIHGTTKENAMNIIKNGFNTEYTFFEIGPPSFGNGYGEYFISVDVEKFYNNIFPDPEGYDTNNHNILENFIYNNIMNNITNDNNSNCTAQDAYNSGYDLNIFTYLFSKEDVGWCFIKGKILSKDIIGIYENPDYNKI